MNDEELKELFKWVVLEGKELEKLCDKLLLAINNTPGFKTTDELNDFYGGKSLKRAYDKLCENGLLNRETISAQLAYSGQCFFTQKGIASPFTEKGKELIRQLTDQS